MTTKFTIDLDIVDHDDPMLQRSLKRAGLKVKHLGVEGPYACHMTGAPTDIVRWCAAHGYTEIMFNVDRVGSAS